MLPSLTLQEVSSVAEILIAVMLFGAVRLTLNAAVQPLASLMVRV